MQKDVNPFINGFSIPYTEIVTETYVEGSIKKSYPMEWDRSIKLYNSAENKEFLYTQLDMWARDLLMAMYYWANSDYQYIIITYEKVLSIYGTYSRRKYDDTIRLLVKKSVIDYKDKSRGQYWYNPRFFASGNRLKMYPECALKMKTIHSNDTIPEPQLVTHE